MLFGTTRPCSQLLTTSRLTPIRSPKAVCDSLLCCRTSLILVCIVSPLCLRLYHPQMSVSTQNSEKYLKNGLTNSKQRDIMSAQAQTKELANPTKEGRTHEQGLFGKAAGGNRQAAADAAGNRAGVHAGRGSRECGGEGSVMKKSKQIKLLKEQNQKLFGDLLRLKLDNALQSRALIELAKKYMMVTGEKFELRWDENEEAE
nr:MAG TPA: hypothetical protein [Caudoviricetes sp.]